MQTHQEPLNHAIVQHRLAQREQERLAPRRHSAAPAMRWAEQVLGTPRPAHHLLSLEAVHA